MKNFQQNGKNLDIVASAAYTSGQLVIEGSLVGVAVADIASGEAGSIACEGVFTFEKTSGSTLAQGAIAYYSTSTKKLNSTTSDDAVGYVVSVDGTTVSLKIVGFLVA